MNLIRDRFGSSIMVGGVDRDEFTSVSIKTTQTVFIDAEQIEELITDLELKLQEIKEMKDAN